MCAVGQFDGIKPDAPFGGKWVVAGEPSDGKALPAAVVSQVSYGGCARNS